jgi:hypothetical protein
MQTYNERAKKELDKWKEKMYKKPSFIDLNLKKVQNSINEILPEKYHDVMTSSIKNMTKIVLLGSKYTTKPPLNNIQLIEKDYFLEEKTRFYRKAAMIEGAGTGAGGIFLGLADFPLLLGIKIKFLYEIAAIYGFNTMDYKERLYILHVFQLAFSSQIKVNEIFNKMQHWDEYIKSLPYDIDQFDWKSFQQEYRDYIDLAKLLQLVPGIGSVVGAYANTKLINKLSNTAKYAYHMRILK